MKDREVRMQIEAFDVEQSAVARVHQYRNTAPPGLVAHFDLDIDRIALLDQEIEPPAIPEEILEVRRCQSFGKAAHPQVGVDLGNFARRDENFRNAEVVNSRADAIQIG